MFHHCRVRLGIVAVVPVVLAVTVLVVVGEEVTWELERATLRHGHRQRLRGDDLQAQALPLGLRALPSPLHLHLPRTVVLTWSLLVVAPWEKAGVMSWKPPNERAVALRLHPAALADPTDPTVRVQRQPMPEGVPTHAPLVVAQLSLHGVGCPHDLRVRDRAVCLPPDSTPVTRRVSTPLGAVVG